MTTPIAELATAELKAMATTLEREYSLVAANKLNLNLSRGKPAEDQLALSEGLEEVLKGDYRAADGTDTRNYGNLRGLAEARELGAQLLDVPADAVIAGGNSSLSLMHLVASTALNVGLWGDERKWQRAQPVRLLAPVPGYDRHFTLSDALGIELIPIDITESGPALDQAMEHAQDPSVKGIWCVPKYSNPTGCIYSKETMTALANMPNAAAADDFVVLLDNAYAVHDIVDPPLTLEPIYPLAKAQGTLEHIVQFASTSKITFAGAGVGFVASGPKVLQSLEQQLSIMTIGPDKVNQLRHARFLQGRLQQHMRAHANLLKPKFELVAKTLTDDLDGFDIARWTNPQGGYFVSLDVWPGLATEVVKLAGDVGLTLTGAGATYPGGDDPHNRNVRIAPTFAQLSELEPAMRILTLCVKLASVQLELTRR